MTIVKTPVSKPSTPLDTMTLQQAKQAFQKADHEWQLAWAAGNPTEMVAAKKARQRAYNKVARLVKATLCN